MATTVFAWYPVTVERPGSQVPFSIGSRAEYEPGDGDVGTLYLDWPGETHDYDVEAVEALDAEQFRFTTGSGQYVVVRQTLPDDGELVDQFLPWKIPMPTEVLGALLQSTIPLPNLSAAVDQQGDVHTLILETNLGLYARYSRTWIRMPDATPIENLSIVDVPASDLDAYDEADSAGDALHITDLHPAAAEVAEYIETEPATPPPVTAATAPPTRTIIIASLADMDEGVAYAATPEGRSSRWYLERRGRALGWTGTYPWQAEP